MECRTREQQYKHDWYIKNKDKSLKRSYESCRTIEGRISTAYTMMKRRVEGRSKTIDSYGLYVGLDILPRKEFIEWSLSIPEYYVLHLQWKESGYLHRLIPTINRLDSSKGYVLGNMEWVSKSINSKLASLKRIYGIEMSGKEAIEAGTVSGIIFNQE